MTQKDVTVGTAVRHYGRDLWQRFIPPDEVGIDEKTGLSVAPFYSNVQEGGGMNQLAIGFDFTWNSASQIDVWVEYARLRAGPFRKPPSIALSGGVATMSDLIYREALTASVARVIHLPINCAFFRVGVEVTGAHATSDILTMDFALKGGTGG